MASAAIVAGGRAARLGGRDKGSLIVGGRTIIDRQLDELSQLTDDIMIVGREGSAFRRSTPKGEIAVRHVPDRVPGRGPLGGLDAALAEAHEPTVLVVACDMPFMTADLLAYLASFADRADVVVPRTARGYHPLCAAYTLACRPAIRRRLAASRLTLMGLLAELRVHVVAESDISAFGDPDRLLANLNTPDDYESLAVAQGHEV